MQASSVADPRPFRTVLAVAVALLLVVVGVAGLKSYRDLAAARAQQQRLEAQIAATRAHIEALEQRVRLLADDPVTLERLAREELWMAYPDDVVIVLPADPPAPTAAAPAAGGAGGEGDATPRR
jgi:cell division protein FtsB